MSKELRDLDISLKDAKLIERALRQAEEEPLQMHKRASNPIPVWRDGQVVWLPPEEISVSAKPAP